jgi:hypothetical protein
MANPGRDSQPDIHRSEQGVLNRSFDETYQVLAVENLVYNPDTGNMDRMTQPGGVSGATSWATNDIEDGTTSYFGKTTADGTWQVIKLTDTSVSYATATNNGGVATYTDAWTGRAALTYGRYDEAF